MKTKLVTAIALAAGLLAVCTAVFAHHGDTVYDLTRVVVLKNAKVTEVLYANPHVLTYFDVTDKDGKVVHWVAEGNSPVNVAKQGWKTLWIFSLNHDLIIECLAAHYNIPLHCGFTTDAVALPRRNRSGAKTGDLRAESDHC